MAPRPAILLIGVLTVAGSAGIGAIRGVPVPKYHDEFSYLLAADTFSTGRVTNPAHPLWEHFETFHVIQQPTYASKFPPAQGLLLAIGQTVTGHPIAGVWLGAALMAAAIAWMLYGWVAPRWAFAGGLVALLQFGVSSYWAQSYWGGAAAAIGGALLFGGFRRVLDGRSSGGAASAAGLVVLANSRPFEGMLVALPVLVSFLVWSLRDVNRRQLHVSRAIVSALGVLVAGGVLTGYYNYRVTGAPWRLPYQVHETTYRVDPIFLWRAPRPTPEYRHDAIREFHTKFELRMYENQLPIGRYGYRVTKLDQFQHLWRFYLGVVLTVPLVALPWVLRDRWLLVPVTSIALLSAGLLLETWVLRHYAAPATAPVVLLVVASLAHVAGGRPRVAAATAVLVLAGLLWRVTTDARAPTEDGWHLRRAALQRQLEADADRHLVVVRYAPGHSAQNEWVVNAADIDASAVVWARDMGDERNQALVRYFHDRRIWLLSVDADDRPHLSRYPPTR